MIGRIGVTLTEAIGGEGDELGFGVDEVHALLTALLLTATEAATKATEAARTLLRLIFLGHGAVQDALSLSLVVNARIVTPAVGGEEERGDEVELAIAGGTIGIAGAVGSAAPCEITLAVARLVLHVFLAPAPQTVEDVLLVHLHGNHHTIRHTLGAGIVVLDIGDISHGVAHLEIDLVGSAEHIVKHFLELGIHILLGVAHLNKQISVLLGFKTSLGPRLTSQKGK